MNQNSRILLPLDTDTSQQALDIVAALRDEVYGFKVGLELINAAGFDLLARLHEAAGADAKIFYDCKFHDIPNTVAGAARAAAKRGIWMMNVHASGGSAMMQAAVQGAREGSDSAGIAKPLVIAVTVLTSLDDDMWRMELGHSDSVAEQVVRLAKLAQESGCDGVVASPLEISEIRNACGADFKLIIPGVRPTGTAIGDQKRILSPGEAAAAGADYLVIGRPITASPDPVSAARAINGEAGF